MLFLKFLKINLSIVNTLNLFNITLIKWDITNEYLNIFSHEPEIFYDVI